MLAKKFFVVCFVFMFMTGCSVEEVSSIEAGSVEEVSSTDTNGNTNPINSGEVRISWSKPGTYENGAPLNDLTGYKIYYNTSVDKIFLNDVVVDQPELTAYTLTNLEPGTSLYVVVTAVNSQNVESQISEVVNISIPGLS